MIRECLPIMRKYNALLAALALIVFFCSPFVGVASISPQNIFESGSVDALVFWEIRTPRAVLAFFVGAALALSGLLFQTLFRNPLMTPFTLGVSSGATLGAAIAIYLGLGASLLGFSAVTLFAFLAAVVTTLLLAAFAGRFRSFATMNLLLLGVALSHFYMAFLFVIYYVGSSLQIHSIVSFTLGNLSTTGFTELSPVVVFSLSLLFVSLFFAPELKLLAVSDENAKLKGVDTTKVTLALLLAVSAAVGAAVSVAGPIGFVGLIIPHLLKKLFRRPAGSLVLTTFIGGGIFLLLCDIVSRSMGTDSEVPIGVVTAFLGGPFFIYLILSRTKN